MEIEQLLELPQSFLHLIIGEWLDLEDVINLESVLKKYADKSTQDRYFLYIENVLFQKSIYDISHRNKQSSEKVSEKVLNNFLMWLEKKNAFIANIKIDVLKQFSNYCHYKRLIQRVKKLKICNGDNSLLYYDLINNLIQKSCGIEDLIIFGFISNCIIDIIFKYCKNLKSLTVKYDNVDVDDSATKNSVRNNTNIEDLNLHVSFTKFLYIIKCCPKLRALKLIFFIKTIENSEYFISFMWLNLLKQYCPLLVELEIESKYIPVDFINHISETFPNLIILRLHQISGSKFDDYQRLTYNLKLNFCLLQEWSIVGSMNLIFNVKFNHLHTINFSENKMIDDFFINQLIKFCPNIQHIKLDDLFKVKNSTVLALIIAYGKTLLSFQLLSCQNVTPIGIMLFLHCIKLKLLVVKSHFSLDDVFTLIANFLKDSIEHFIVGSINPEELKEGLRAIFTGKTKVRVIDDNEDNDWDMIF